jgi:hypothetical protein
MTQHPDPPDRDSTILDVPDLDAAAFAIDLQVEHYTLRANRRRAVMGPASNDKV